MSSLHSYTFNNMGSLTSDLTDQTQQNIQNTRFGSYTLSNFFSNSASDSQIQFATQQPGILVRNGGVAGAVIDIESNFLIGLSFLNFLLYQIIQIFNLQWWTNFSELCRIM